VISELAIRQPNLEYFDINKTANFPAQAPLSIADLEIIYPQAAQNCKDDPARLELAKNATVELQQGRPGYRALWQHLVNISVEQMRANYKNLNVSFDLWDGESTIHDQIAPIIDKLIQQNMATTSNGAIVIHVQQDDDKENVPPLILYKQDGAVMYGTTDLVTIVTRLRDYTPQKIIYIVDKRQHLHFEQVFRAVRKTHLAPDSLDLVFVGHGTMNGTDGKPFKTRAGGVMKLEDLITSSIDKAIARMQVANITNDFSVAHKVAISAIKFADLQNNPSSDYIFDLDRMISFEGKTGPYLLYQAVRIKSLLEKAHWSSSMTPKTLSFATINDHSLGLFLLNFENALQNVISHHTPHLLADYLYKLAQSFSSFYASCPVLAENQDDIKASRLLLAALTLKQLTIGLDLLGIDIPDKM
jgi:arginyl-tRNA synthetase